jgi:hypothetical protein
MTVIYQDTPMPASDREIILELFERHRQTPGAPFHESRFLDYLLANPSRKHAVHNSFSGPRRFNAFIDAVQLEFSICFSVRDREAHYSLEKFVDRVGVLKNSRRSSLASLRNQQPRGFDWGIAFVLNLFGALPLIFAMKLWRPLGALVAILLVLANAGLVRFYRREQAYHARLLAQVQGSAPDAGAARKRVGQP